MDKRVCQKCQFEYPIESFKMCVNYINATFYVNCMIIHCEIHNGSPPVKITQEQFKS